MNKSPPRVQISQESLTNFLALKNKEKSKKKTKNKKQNMVDFLGLVVFKAYHFANMESALVCHQPNDPRCADRSILALNQAIFMKRMGRS